MSPSSHGTPNLPRAKRRSTLAAARRGAFLGIDRLRGGTITKHVAQIEAALADPGGGAWRAQRDAQLAELLRHVSATVPFYRELLPADPRMSRLSDLPVLDKRVYHERFDDLCSTAFDIPSLPTVHTSASTGVPLRAPRDPGKRARHVADLIATGRLAGFDFGDPLLFLTVSRGLNGRSTRQKLQGIRYINAQMLDDTLVSTVADAVANSPVKVFVIGFPSALDHIGRSLLAAGRPIPPGHIAGVVTISEAKTAWLSAHGEEAFGAPVRARYSNEENGLLAQQALDSDGRFLVNRASYIIELLALDSDEPVPVGEVGRIVVTDLFSRAMPFIRYDTGDLGRSSHEHPGDLAEIIGRRGDVIYDENGRAIAPTTLLYTMLAFDDVWRFQLAQTDRTSYRFTAIAAPDAARDAALEQALRGLLGAGAQLSIEYVDEIAAMPSGKRRPVANLWGRPTS